jgi:dihydroxyacetone kinase
MLAAAQSIATNQGVLFIVKNYAGDILNKNRHNNKLTANIENIISLLIIFILFPS